MSGADRAPPSSPSSLALVRICSLGLTAGPEQGTSQEVSLAAQSIFPEPPQATSEGHHFGQSEQTQIHSCFYSRCTASTQSCRTRGFSLPGDYSGPGDTCHAPWGSPLHSPLPPDQTPFGRKPGRQTMPEAWLRKGHTHSESGDSSEMLWEVVERGVEGHIAEGVEVCMAEGVAVVWGPEGVLEDCTEDRTEELKEARMEERISNCSVEGCRLGTASRFSLEGCLLDSGSRLSLDSCLLERLPRLSCEGCLLGTVSRGSLELDLLERKSSCSLDVCLADASWSLEGCLLESKSNCSREVSRLGNVSIRSLDTCLLGNVFSHSLDTSLTGPQSSCSLDPNLQGKVSRWSLEPCLRGSVFP